MHFYVDTETGEVSVDYFKEVDNGLAQAIFNEIKNVVEEDLNIDGFAAFGSDGCSIMMGKNTGVATRLKEIKPQLNCNSLQQPSTSLSFKGQF